MVWGLEDIDRMSSKRQDDTHRDSPECLEELTNAGLFALFNAPLPTDSITVGPEETPIEDVTLEDE